jgi:uncharacterized membrane protein
MQKALVYLLILVSLVGIADSSYLSHAAVTGSPLNCSVFDGCNIVAASPYSKVYGIPLALFGLVFYIVALGLTASMLTMDSRGLRKAVFAWSIAGVLFSAYFMYLQYFKIEAICLYCVISAVATVLLLICSSLLLKQA